jgi:hypothetical protein
MPRLAALALFASLMIAADSPICNTAFAASCCKVCTKGKACGDTCLAKSSTCTKGKGCACNG